MVRHRTTKRRRRPFSAVLLEWFDSVCATSSMHGAPWIVAIKNGYLKFIAFNGINLVFWGTVAVLVMQGLDFVRDKNIQSTRVSSRTGGIKFPQITLCHPWYFERKAFLGKQPKQETAKGTRAQM